MTWSTTLALSRGAADVAIEAVNEARNHAVKNEFFPIDDADDVSSCLSRACSLADQSSTFRPWNRPR